MLCRLILVAAVLFPLTVFATAAESGKLATGDSLWDSSLLMEEIVADSLQPISLKEFRENSLMDKEIFLHAYPGPEHSNIFAVSKNQCLLLELPGEEELKPLLAQLYDLVSHADSDQDEQQAIAEQVSSLLLGNLGIEWDSFQNITFAPVGIFNLVPTSLLLNESPEISIVRVASASILMELRQAAAKKPKIIKPRILAVGGVVGYAEIGSSRPFQELQHLDDTYADVTVVRPNPGGGAPELDKLLGFDVIHVAAQCIGDDRNPLKSAIALDPTDPQMMIWASALNDVRLDTRLVVLSRCNTVEGEFHSGEGLQSLTGSFLAAGVSAVVAALWSVDDGATGFFMASFYEGLFQGKDAASALAFARTKCQLDPVFSHSHYWSAFVLMGDGRVEVPLQTKSGFGGIARLLVLLAGAAAGLIFILRQRR